jgi:hypothetical protein
MAGSKKHRQNKNKKKGSGNREQGTGLFSCMGKQQASRIPHF